jgi:catechol 2,3-dioxygenase-like lactoylglutathione lyase family enzyme
MPDITGLYFVGLSVRDVGRSTAWYTEVLGLTTVQEAVDADRRHGGVVLRHPPSGLLIGLFAHRSNPGEPFSELRTGLDHLEFGVANRAELEAWAARLDALGVDRSPIKERPSACILTFRDPDNIQLEFYVRMG